MTIKRKLTISTFVLIATLLILSLTILNGYRYVTEKASLANDFDKESMYLQMMLRGLNEVLVNDGTPTSIETAREGLKGFDAIHKRLLAEIKDPETLLILTEDIDLHWKSIKENIDPFFEHYLNLEDDESLIRAGKLIAESETIIKHVMLLAEDTRSVVNENSKKSAIVEKIIIFLVLMLFMLSTYVAYHIYLSITRPIEELTTIAEGFNKGDLSIMMDESRGDEFGSLAKYFNKSTTKLNQATQKLQERSNELTELNIQLKSEIADRKKAEKHISHIAFHDSLTNLPNRFLFLDRLSMYINHIRRNQGKAAILFLDIDDFKRINDTLGHSTGDILLKGVADKISGCIRNTDSVSHQTIYDVATSTVARLGGDEFTILLTDIIDSQCVLKVVQRLIESLSHPFQLNSSEVFITVSIGIAICPDDGEDADTVIKNADTAMYDAKNRGKNNFQFFKESMNTRSLKSLTLENDLRKAIERNELLLYYQPRIDVQTGNIVSMEALVRWEKPDEGLVSPAEFIPVAEDTGLIIPMGKWILRTACSQNKAWQESGLPPICVSVNISGKQFQQDNFIPTILDALKSSYLDPRYLELEITENVLMHNAKITIDMLSTFKKMGIRISMDDFGTGYSSFSYLKRFPLDIIKIDKSFIEDIPENTDTATIVTAILSMAHSLNLTVVGEGVETRQQLDFLRDYECDEVQGFYFSRPLPAKKVTEMLEKSTHLPLETG